MAGGAVGGAIGAPLGPVGFGVGYLAGSLIGGVGSSMLINCLSDWCTRNLFDLPKDEA